MHARLYKFYAPERETVAPIYGWAKSERTAKKYRNMLNCDPRNYYARVYEEVTALEKLQIWDSSGVDLRAEVSRKFVGDTRKYLPIAIAGTVIAIFLWTLGAKIDNWSKEWMFHNNAGFSQRSLGYERSCKKVELGAYSDNPNEPNRYFCECKWNV